jgi:hypothetical protein
MVLACVHRHGWIFAIAKAYHGRGDWIERLAKRQKVNNFQSNFGPIKGLIAPCDSA